MAQVQVSTPERGKIKTNAALYRRKTRHCKIKKLEQGAKK
jgi:hypothetical protein